MSDESVSAPHLRVRIRLPFYFCISLIRSINKYVFPVHVLILNLIFFTNESGSADPGPISILFLYCPDSIHRLMSCSCPIPFSVLFQGTNVIGVICFWAQFYCITFLHITVNLLLTLIKFSYLTSPDPRICRGSGSNYHLNSVFLRFAPSINIVFIFII